jgi:molybdate transport system substrate-binding protein
LAKCFFPNDPNSATAWEDTMPQPVCLLRPYRFPSTATIAKIVRFAAIAVSVAFCTHRAGAAEIKLLSAAAMQSVLKEAVADFERDSGHKLIIAYDTIGGIERRLRNGESHDVIIGSNLIMPALAREGRIDSNSLVNVSRTAIGAVVSEGTPKPAFASVDDFKRALLDAKFIVYADPARGGAAGVHIAREIQKLGLTEQVKAKTRVAAGGDITEVTLALGDGALGMTQMSEIVQKKGAQLVGPLPAELQNYTVFVAGTPAQVSDAAKAFIAFLRGAHVRAVIEAKGMQPGA